MSETLKIILTSSLTIFGGVIVLVIGQFVSKFVIDSMYEQSKLIGEIANSLIYYANVDPGIESHYLQQIENLRKQDNLHESTRTLLVERYEKQLRSEWSRSDEARISLRQQASKLMGNTNSIPLYGALVAASFWVLPTRKSIIEASKELIGLSNDPSKGANRAKKIAKLLRIKIISERIDEG